MAYFLKSQTCNRAFVIFTIISFIIRLLFKKKSVMPQPLDPVSKGSNLNPVLIFQGHRSLSSCSIVSFIPTLLIYLLMTTLFNFQGVSMIKFAMIIKFIFWFKKKQINFVWGHLYDFQTFPSVLKLLMSFIRKRNHRLAILFARVICVWLL